MTIANYEMLTDADRASLELKLGPRKGIRCPYTGVWLKTPLNAAEHLKDFFSGMVIIEREVVFNEAPTFGSNFSIHDYVYREPPIGLERNVQPYDNSQKSRRTRRKP